MTDYETAYRALREGLEALADEWDSGIPCDCGHSLDTHNGLGCYERLSYEPLVKCDCALTDDRHDGQLASIILRALLAPSPAEGTGEAGRTSTRVIARAAAEGHCTSHLEFEGTCLWCGTARDNLARATPPAPVSSGEAGTRKPAPDCPLCDIEAFWRGDPCDHPAAAVDPSAEGDETDG